MRKIILLYLVFYWIGGSQNLLAISTSSVNQVYQQLVSAIGDRKTSPTLKIEPSTQTERLAWYQPRYNSIFINDALLEFADEFGTDSSTVISLILSHELAHHYENHNQQLAFVGGESKVIHEAEADKFAIFFSYMAGYPTEHLDSIFLTKLYQKFQLKDGEHYPSLKERIQIFKNARQELTQLFQFFEAGNLLLLLNQYEIAAKCFDYMGTHFNSPEVLNNAGVSYTLAALSFFDDSEMPYLFPLEFEEGTTLPKKMRGNNLNRDLSDEEMAYLKNNYLSLAENFFKRLLIATPRNVDAYNNLATVYMLQAFLSEKDKLLFPMARNEINNALLFVISDSQEDANILLTQGTLAALQGNKDDANNYFTKAINQYQDELAKRNLCSLMDDCERQRRLREKACDKAEELDGISLLLGGKKLLQEKTMNVTPITLSKIDAQMQIFSNIFNNTRAWLMVNDEYTFEKDFRSTFYVLETNSHYEDATCKGIRIGDSLDKIKQNYGSASEVKYSNTLHYHKYSSSLLIFGVKDNKVEKIINYSIEQTY